MTKLRCLITDHGFPNLRHEEAVLSAAGIERAGKQLAAFGRPRKLDSARHCQRN